MLDHEALSMIKMTAPGTLLREGLDSIIRAGNGALIVVTDPEKLTCLIDGGFRIDCEFKPAYLYELSKMDGAIVLNKDASRIVMANTMLIPDPLIQTSETGTRHRAAERTARQTGELVICISERRSTISLYKGELKVVLRSPSEIMTYASNALQTLDKNRKVLMQELDKLTNLEFSDMCRYTDVINVIICCEIAMRIADEIRTCICELGVEGRLISIQLEELLTNIEDEELLILEDYMAECCGLQPVEMIEKLHRLSEDDMARHEVIFCLLGYDPAVVPMDSLVSPRGFRALSKIARLPKNVQGNIICAFSNLKGIIAATVDQLDLVDGIGGQRARSINQGIKRFKERLCLDPDPE